MAGIGRFLQGQKLKFQANRSNASVDKKLEYQLFKTQNGIVNFARNNTPSISSKSTSGTLDSFKSGTQKLWGGNKIYDNHLTQWLAGEKR